MRIEAMPELVASRILENVVFSENFLAGDGIDLARYGDGIVHGPEWVRERMELAACELCRDVVCKTRSEKRDVRGVVYLESRFGYVYFGKKLHMIKYR